MAVFSWIARGPGFEYRSGHYLIVPCDIWWLSVGSRLESRASKSVCLVGTFVITCRFEDESY